MRPITAQGRQRAAAVAYAVSSPEAFALNGGVLAVLLESVLTMTSSLLVRPVLSGDTQCRRETVAQLDSLFYGVLCV